MPGPAKAASASSAVSSSAGSSAGSRRISSARASPPALAGGAPRLAGAPGERGRHDHQREQRRRRDPQRDRVLAAGDADRDRQREAQPRDRLHQHESAEQPEALVPGEPAAGEVAGRVGERADDQHPVERVAAFEDVVDELFVQRQRDDQEHQREARLQQHRRAQRVLLVPARPAPGDRAREQLFDRAGRSPR